MNPARDLPLANPRSAVRRLVGLVCALLFIGALVALGVWSGGWLRPREEFRARVRGGTELTKSSPVRLLGQAIGRVSAVELVTEDGAPTVEARFWIERAHAAWLRDGATVTVRSGFVGGPWLDVAPGPAGGVPLAAGSVLDAAIEQSTLERILEIQPVIEQLIVRVAGLVETLEGTTKRIDPILAQVEGQLATTRVGLEQIALLLQDARAVFEQVKNDQAKLVAGVALTLERVNDELLPGIDATVRQSRETMAGTFGELDATLDVVQARLPALLDVTQETLQNTRDITEATKHTWPFSSYWKRKAREEAAAAAKARREAR